MGRKVVIIGAVLALFLFLIAGFGGWSVRNIKVVEQAKATELLKKEVVQTTEAKELAVNEIKRQLNLLEKALGQANERADNAELAKKTLIEQVKASEIVEEEALKQAEKAKREGVAEGKEAGLKEGYEKGYREGYQKDRPRNPTYAELQEILRNWTFTILVPNSCVWVTGFFTNEMSERGIRVALVHLSFLDFGHVLVAFDPPDKEDLVYIDIVPKTEGSRTFILREVKVELFRPYYKDNNIENLNDIVYDIQIVW